MNTELYNIIRNKIIADVPAIKTVRLYNNQFAHANNDNTDNNDEQAFEYPCLFIEFSDIEFETQLTLLQQWNGVLRVYIGVERYTLENTEVLDLKQTVYKCLHGFSPSPTTKNYDLILRTGETTDTDHNNVYVYVQEYKCGGKDLDKSTTDGQVSVTVTELELLTDLDIDNQVIRTGDGT